MRHHLTAALLCCLCACEETGSRVGIAEDEAVNLAREAAQETFSALSAELAEAIAEGGPVAAIPVCAERAGEITREVAGRRNLDIVRLSDRPRNPSQEARGDDLEAIRHFRTELQAGRQPGPVAEPGAGGSAVVRLPIVISQPLCLQCHGGDEEVAEATREAIADVYPDDRARGYTLNDLRGLWKITVRPDSER